MKHVFTFLVLLIASLSLLIFFFPLSVPLFLWRFFVKHPFHRWMSSVYACAVVLVMRLLGGRWLVDVFAQNASLLGEAASWIVSWGVGAFIAAFSYQLADEIATRYFRIRQQAADY